MHNVFFSFKCRESDSQTADKNRETAISNTVLQLVTSQSFESFVELFMQQKNMMTIDKFLGSGKLSKGIRH